MKTLSAISILILLLHASSIAQKILVPADFHPQDNPVTHSTIDDLDRVIIAECLEVNDRALVFDLEIRNLSLARMDVHPEQISIMASEKPFPVSQSATLQQVMAFESNLHQYPAMSGREVHRKYSSIIKQRKGLSIALTALAAGLAVYDAAKDAEDWHKSFWTESDFRKSRARDAGVVAALLVADISRHFIGEANAKTSEDLHYLDREILDTNSLEPMDAVRGKLFFPAKRSRYYRIIVPLGDTQYAFDFKMPNARERKAVRKIRK